MTVTFYLAKSSSSDALNSLQSIKKNECSNLVIPTFYINEQDILNHVRKQITFFMQ